MTMFWPQLQLGRLHLILAAVKGVGRKISRGGQRKKSPKNNKKKTEKSTIKPFPGGANGKKDRKIAKKNWK